MPDGLTHATPIHATIHDMPQIIFSDSVWIGISRPGYGRLALAASILTFCHFHGGIPFGGGRICLCFRSVWVGHMDRARRRKTEIHSRLVK